LLLLAGYVPFRLILRGPTTLVLKGLYRYVRHPMYVGVLTLLLGEAEFFRSLPLLEYAALCWVAFHLFVLLYEEPALRHRFGASPAQRLPPPQRRAIALDVRTDRRRVVVRELKAFKTSE
jgi:hypothetical protein